MTPPAASILGHGRTTSSHTISVPHLSELLRYIPAESPYGAYAHAVVEQNILGRPTHVGRIRVLRHLRELYGLGGEGAFPILRLLHGMYPESLPVLAGLVAATRDEFFRASWPVVARASGGERVSTDLFAHAIADQFTGQVSASTYAKAGRNVSASWVQTTHLTGSRVKVRVRATAGPAPVALAVALGYLEGRRGPGLLETTWFAMLDVPPDGLRAALVEAHRAGLIDLHEAGTVLEIDPSAVLKQARELSRAMA